MRTKQEERNPWGEKPYEDIPCKAEDCRYNIRVRCMVPSHRELDADAKCIMYQTKSSPKTLMEIFAKEEKHAE